MKICRRRFLKSLAFAGVIATIGFSGCVSTPEDKPTPTPISIPTTKPPASEPKPTRRFFDVGTDLKPCPDCGNGMHLQDVYSVLFWICEHEDCEYFEKATEPEILRKYGYS